MILYCLITKYITVGVLLYEIHDNPFTVFTCYTLIQREREKKLVVCLPSVEGEMGQCWRGEGTEGTRGSPLSRPFFFPDVFVVA